MRFPYQDGPKKKVRPPTPTPIPPESTTHRNDEIASEDGKEREGKRRTNGPTQTTTVASPTSNQAAVKLLNMVMVVLVVCVGVLLANKFF
jgi:hypothetical protein